MNAITIGSDCSYIYTENIHLNTRKFHIPKTGKKKTKQVLDGLKTASKIALPIVAAAVPGAAVPIAVANAAVDAAPAIADATKKKPADPAPAPAPADPAAPVLVAPATQTVATPASVKVAEGDPIMCVANDVGVKANSAIYRFTVPNVLRHYKSSAILKAWDPAYKAPKKLDCAGLTLGDPMEMPSKPSTTVTTKPSAQPATVSVTEGDSIICLVNDVGAGANSAIYRFTSPNILRYYTTQTILSAWNPANTPPTKLDCDGMTLGEPMQLPDTQTAPVSSNSTVPATYNSSATAETV